MPSRVCENGLKSKYLYHFPLKYMLLLLEVQATMSNSGKPGYVFSALVIIALLLITIPAVSAYTVSQVTNPAIPLHSGDTISVSVSGLTAGDNFKFRLTSSDLDTQGDTVVSNSVNLPFGFKSAVTHMSTTGYTLAANPLTVDYNGGDVHYNPTYPAGTNPIEITKSDINSGDYVVSLKGTKISGSPTSIDYSVSGKVGTVPKSDPQTLTFTIKNVNSGHLTIDVFDGGVTQYSQTYTIGTATQGSGSSPGAGSGGDDRQSGSDEVAESGGAQLAPPGFASSSLTLLHNDEGTLLTDSSVGTDPEPGFTVTLDIRQRTKVISPDRKPVDVITLTPLDPSVVPPDSANIYSVLGIAVECDPSGTQFSPDSGATLSFSLSPELWASALDNLNGDSAAMTIGFYDTTSGTWVALPTTVDPVTRTVSASITHFSTYGLIAKPANDAPATSPQTFGSLVSPAPTGTAAAATPAPGISQKAPPEPTPSPGLPGIAVIGIVLVVGYCVVRKKQ